MRTTITWTPVPRLWLRPATVAAATAAALAAKLLFLPTRTSSAWLPRSRNSPHPRVTFVLLLYLDNQRQSKHRLRVSALEHCSRQPQPRSPPSRSSSQLELPPRGCHAPGTARVRDSLFVLLLYSDNQSKASTASKPRRTEFASQCSFRVALSYRRQRGTLVAATSFQGNEYLLSRCIWHQQIHLVTALPPSERI